ncbi:hypothetical protein OESDEN_02170 [Oesophagostomum dentatum]|uniref:Uncharacterized protein n=1 Tax=Oesophagostomum dentatum TaxID=61180 RepID=A0A0B1TJW2_OESDE|nr:hypothetical protein OESDEN_02170 [Oesophagostomum dentatum]
MFVIVFLALCSGVTSSVSDVFTRNGLQFEKIGRTKLIDGSRACNSRRISLLPYVDTLTLNEEADEVDFLILKARLQQTFSDTCQTFNLTIDNSTLAYESSVTSGRPSRYLDRFRLEWNVRKYRLDLTTLLTHSKFHAPFYPAIEEDWLNEEIDSEEFAVSTIIVPERCEVAEMALVARLCADFQETAKNGDLYAIVHAGEMVENSKVFVYYEVPEYVLVVGKDAIPVEFGSCEAVNGSFFLCTERARSSCDVTTMASCEIYARSTPANFSFSRRFGSGTIVATNLPEMYVDGSHISVNSPVFTYRISQHIEKDSADLPVVVEFLTTAPAVVEESFPKLTREAEEAVHSSAGALQLHRTSRKGVHVLSNQVRVLKIYKTNGNR